MVILRPRPAVSPSKLLFPYVGIMHRAQSIVDPDEMLERKAGKFTELQLSQELLQLRAGIG